MATRCGTEGIAERWQCIIEEDSREFGTVMPERVSRIIEIYRRQIKKGAAAQRLGVYIGTSGRVYIFGSISAWYIDLSLLYSEGILILMHKNAGREGWHRQNKRITTIGKLFVYIKNHEIAESRRLQASRILELCDTISARRYT